VLVVIVVVVTIGLTALAGGRSGCGVVSVTVDPGRIVGTSQLAIGVTHARRSADAWAIPPPWREPAVSCARRRRCRTST
jgi:hypothetical protein